MVAQQEMFNCTNFAPGDFLPKEKMVMETGFFFGSEKIFPPTTNGYDIYIYNFYNIYIYIQIYIYILYVW